MRIHLKLINCTMNSNAINGKVSKKVSYACYDEFISRSSSDIGIIDIFVHLRKKIFDGYR